MPTFETAGIRPQKSQKSNKYKYLLTNDDEMAWLINVNFIYSYMAYNECEF